MWNLREYEHRAQRLSDRLPWAALVAPGVVLNKDGSFQRTAAFRGADLDSSTEAELAAAAARMNGVLRRLGSGWALFAEAERRSAPDYPESRFGDALSALVDEERRAAFTEAGAAFESRYFLTLVWLPPAETPRRLERLLFDRPATIEVDWRGHLAAFTDRVERIEGLLEGVMPSFRWLDDAETLTHLHAAISDRPQGVAPPETPMYLDAILADTPLLGGLQPRLGERHLRVLSVNGFPSATWPGLLDDLNGLGFPYRWSTRALCLDKLEATRLLTRIRRQWFAKRKSVLALLKEALTQEPSALLDNDAANKAADADAALQALGGDEAGYALVTAVVVVDDPDPVLADAKLRQVEKVIQSRDFTCRLETLNAVEAWLGSLPGHCYANVRQPPLSTLNLAHMLPLSAVWAGEAGDAHLSGPPLFLARTEGSTPFRFCLHVGDVGHALVVGPTGAGKSVALALMALQFPRYPGAQVFAFDFGSSLRACALGMGGAWRNLDPASPSAPTLQPLARVDEEGERTWAAEWLAGLLAREGVEVTPSVRSSLWSALTSLASAPTRQRTLTGLGALLQDGALKTALAPFTLEGPFGRLLDGEDEPLGDEALQVFEIEGLFGTKAAAPVLAYLFHRLTRRLDGRPTLVVLDEGWLALDDQIFGAQLRVWLKTLRKKNAAIVLATQSLADLGDSPLAAAVIEACQTRIFLPNPRALEPGVGAAYRRFGLNARQIELIGHAAPKRDYYVQSPQGRRLIELGLGPVALAFCATADKTDQARIDAVLARAAPDRFAAEWLEAQGLSWAAGLLDAKPHTPEAAE